jgi:ferredoxin
MIIARQKPFTEVLEALGDARRVYIVGCGECATQTATGGAEEVADLARRLEEEGKSVVAVDVAHSVCQELDIKRLFRAHGEAVEAADVFLVLSCGAGSQAVIEATEKRVVAGTDTLFLGNVRRHFDYQEKCSLCGDCVIDRFGGVCPVVRCSKGLLNGPCGGANHGRCEVDDARECAWTIIYRRLEAQGRLDDLRTIHGPKAWDGVQRPGRADWRAEKKEKRRRSGE